MSSTTTPKGWIITAGALIVLAGAGVTYYVIRTRKQKKANRQMLASGGSTPKGAGRFRCTSTGYPLNYGTCHPDVGVLQRYLGKTFGATLVTDNKFGNNTRQAALTHLKKDQFDTKDLAAMKAALNFILR